MVARVLVLCFLITTVWFPAHIARIGVPFMARLIKNAGAKTKTTALKLKNKVTGKEIGKGDLVRLNKFRNAVLVEGWHGRVSSAEPSGYFYVRGINQQHEINGGVRNNIWLIRGGLLDLVKKAKTLKGASKVKVRVGDEVEISLTAEEAKAQGYTITLPGTRWFVTGVYKGYIHVTKKRGGNAEHNVTDGFYKLHQSLADYHAEIIKADEGKALDPDTHKHLWKVKWNVDGGTNAYRLCHCGAKEWKLACWTGHGYQRQVPEALLKARPDLDELKITTKGKFEWIKQPHRMRFLDLIGDNVIHEPINIIGAGAIGSFTALALVKMGFSNLRVWDDQLVEVENIGTQLYGDYYQRTRLAKVAALQQMMGADASSLGPPNANNKNLKLTAHNRRYAGEALNGVVIMAVDSMAARSMIWKANRNKKQVSWIIDGRMGAEQARLYTMNPNDPADIKTYEKTLYTDEQAINEPCTRAGTVYTALLISGEIGKAVAYALNDNPKYPRIIEWDIRNNHQRVYTKNQVFTKPEDTGGDAVKKAAAPMK